MFSAPLPCNGFAATCLVGAVFLVGEQAELVAGPPEVEASRTADVATQHRVTRVNLLPRSGRDPKMHEVPSVRGAGGKNEHSLTADALVISNGRAPAPWSSRCATGLGACVFEAGSVSRGSTVSRKGGAPQGSRR